MTDFILIEGRGRANAVLALAATELAGHDASIVRTVGNGYEVPAEAREFYDRLVEGEKIDAPDAGDQLPDTEPIEVQPEGVEEPAKNASKKAWEAFAAENHGYDKSEGLTRDQIIERYGSSE